MKRTIIGMVVVLLLSACATTKQYTPMATREELKTGNALIRIERETGIIGAGRSVEVTDNGVKTGSLSPGNSITWERSAGPMDINLAPAALAVTQGEPIHVDVVAGNEYQFVTMWSWAANTFVIRKK